MGEGLKVFEFDHSVLTLMPIENAVKEWTSYSHLLPENSERFAEKRKIEFIAGRLCAIEALKKIHILDAKAPAVGEGRQPLWPPGVVGSISHSKLQAAAIVSKKLGFLGVDIEAPIEKERFEKIGSQFLNEFERNLIKNDSYLGTIIFSSKESLFKAVYPEVETFFGFHDAQVIEITNKSFKIEITRNDGKFSSFKYPILGSFWEQSGEIITLIEIEKTP